MARHPADPSDSTTKTLFAYSNNLCAFQDPMTHVGCEHRLTDPSWDQVKAEICHIQGKRLGSARYNEDMTDEERRAFNNLILLCPTHHTQVDDCEPRRFTVEILTEMKYKALENVEPFERWATDALLDRAVIAVKLVMARIDQPLEPVQMNPVGREARDSSSSEDFVVSPGSAHGHIEIRAGESSLPEAVLAIHQMVNQILGYGTIVSITPGINESLYFGINRPLTAAQQASLIALANERNTSFRMGSQEGGEVWHFAPNPAA